LCGWRLPLSSDFLPVSSNLQGNAAENSVVRLISSLSLNDAQYSTAVIVLPELVILLLVLVILLLVLVILLLVLVILLLVLVILLTLVLLILLTLVLWLYY